MTKRKKDILGSVSGLVLSAAAYVWTTTARIREKMFMSALHNNDFNVKSEVKTAIIFFIGGFAVWTGMTAVFLTLKYKKDISKSARKVLLTFHYLILAVLGFFFIYPAAISLPSPLSRILAGAAIFLIAGFIAVIAHPERQTEP